MAERFGVPVFLYEEAAASPHRRNLEDIRRGEFEGLAEKMRDPHGRRTSARRLRTPRRGPASSARACRSSPTTSTWQPRTSTWPRSIAKGIRHSSGGFRYVKAMGVMLEERGVAQVSINLTDFEKTPLFRVFETVKREAARYGVAVLGSEIVGLVPAEALIDAAEHFLRLERFDPTQVLERRIREAE